MSRVSDLRSSFNLSLTTPSAASNSNGEFALTLAALLSKSPSSIHSLQCSDIMANKELRLAISFRSTDDKPKRICSEPTFIKSWGPDEVENDIDVDELSKRPPWGVAAGCANGSIYLFHPDLSKTTKRQKSLKLRRLSGEGPPYRRAAHNHLSLSRSRNASPAGSRTNLAMTSTKSRAVSGLTRTEVEAPKNYVDFEEEQEKMKSMIADRSSREPKDRSPRSSIVSPVEVPSLRFDDAKSISSIPSSSSLLSPPLSPPLSPALDAQRVTHSRKHLRLHARITPRDFGHGHAIVCLDILEEGELLLALQESGYVMLYYLFSRYSDRIGSFQYSGHSTV